MRKVWAAFLVSLVAFSISLGLAASRAGASGFSGGGSGGGNVTRVGARVSNVADQSISSALAWSLYSQAGAATEFNHGMTIGAGDSSITVPFDGTYLVIIQCAFAANNAGERSSAYYVNGTLKIGATFATNDGSGALFPSSSWLADLAAGDKVQAGFLQNSGAPLNTHLGALNVVLVGGGPGSGFVGGTLTAGVNWATGGSYTPTAPELLGPTDGPMITTSSTAGNDVVDFQYARGLTSNTTTTVFTIPMGTNDTGVSAHITWSAYGADGAGNDCCTCGGENVSVMRNHTGTVLAALVSGADTRPSAGGSSFSSVTWSVSISGTSALVKVNADGTAGGLVGIAAQYHVTVMGYNARAVTINPYP